MLIPGTILGERYEIIEKIGAGGMSIVYKAKCNRLQRFVAVKVLREEFVKDEVFVNKFKVEALSAASLSHPNIVGIYDVGNNQDLHYIVMEYVEGQTLKELIAKEGPLAQDRVLEYGLQMLGAVRNAHQKQIIHRDIKPQNILVTSENVLKVTDFGIA
ncbi:MAG: protein kinase domain-containing protein, partial [Cellulosilyticaceae bacterium]